MPAPLLPVLLTLGSVLSLVYGWRGRRRGAPDTPTTELIEAITAGAGQPVAYSVLTLDDGTQVVTLPADDPSMAADAAHALDLPACRIVADVDGLAVQLYPHPEMKRGECELYLLAGGELVPLVPLTSDGGSW